MAILKKIIPLTASMLLILGGLQGCGESEDPQDLSVTQAVMAKIKAEAQVPEDMVSVETKKGKVTLTGSIDTADEEKRLLSIAQSVQGVKSVESHLVVKESSIVKEQIPMPISSPSAPSTSQGNQGISTQSTSQEAASVPVSPTTMSSEQPQQGAAAPQTDMQSSSSVVTQPPSNIEDVAVTARVKSLLMADPAYQNVTIETQSGVVSLTGTVNAQSDAEAMIKKIEAIEGVKKVDSKVTVKPTGSQ